MTSQQPATEAAKDSSGALSPSRVIPVALLILLMLIGLRGKGSPLAWQGPLHGRAEIVGIVLEVILGVLLVITLRRGRDTGTDVARVLRTGLRYVLTACMIALGATLLLNIPLHLSAKYKPQLAQKTKPPLCGHPGCVPHHAAKGTGGMDLQWVLYILLIAVIVTAVIMALRWRSAFARRRAPVPEGPIATDADSLRSAVSEGAAALRAGAFDDARKAIIACYVAMEQSLADRGAARNEADTPDELLSRATAAGVIGGTAAGRLTGLFYEARFSSHPLGDDKREAARQALDEIAASLDQKTEAVPQ